MELKNKKIAIMFKNSCNIMQKLIPVVKKIKNENADIYPIIINNKEDTYYFNKNQDEDENKNEILKNKISKICNKKIINTKEIKNNQIFDIIIIIPTNSNIISKLVVDIIDTPELITIKQCLNNNLPVVLAPMVNDGLGTAAINIATLLNRKNIYFVPFKQSNPITKPKFIMFDFLYIIPTIEYGLSNEQIEPMLL